MWQRILVENGFEDPSLHINFHLVATCLWKCHLSFEAHFPQCKMSCSSVVKSCPTLCGPIDCSTSGFSVLHYLPEFAQTHVLWVNDAIQTSPLLLPPSPHALNFSQHQGFFFSSELVLHIRWPNYWNFSFSISPFKEYSELIFFRIDWFDQMSAMVVIA